MRYLKLFEDVNSGYGEMRILSNEIEDRSCSFDVKSSNYKKLIDLGFKFRDAQFSDKRSIVTRYEVNIYKLNDEWYYISSWSIFPLFQTNAGAIRRRSLKSYQCDQFDGLLACLKNEFGIE